MQIYEFFKDENNYYIITEYCDGGELFEKITKLGAFTEVMAAEVMKQIFTAISYLHSEKIVHRDLKPDNMLLEGKDKMFIKIIDFGTSRTFDKSQVLKEKTGTPYYIAPEVLNRNYDEKCDLWSCGVILYILIVGSPPFNGKDSNEIMESVKLGIYDKSVLSSASKEVASLIEKLLEFDPKNRISAQEALEHSWIKSKAKGVSVKKELGINVLKNIRKFNAEKMLEKATCNFIMNFLINKKELEVLKNIFSQMDSNNDGRLSLEEIKKAYDSFIGFANTAELEDIFKRLDSDNNGSISYDGFMLI